MKAPSPKILITPLNWGLGHATRCIPLIREFLSHGCEVVIGASGASASLLRQEFPDLPHITTPGPKIRYAKRGGLFAIFLIGQLPGLFKQFYQEKKWILKAVHELKPDLIVSDNRYGCFHPNIPSALVTHQLNIKTGLGGFFDRLMRRLLYRLFNNFNEVWVPDCPTEVSFGGELSHPIIKPKVPVYYIGPLNRFQERSTPINRGESLNLSNEKNFQLLVLLSGPEPQRSILESMVSQQLIDLPVQACLLRGLPSNEESATEGVSQKHFGNSLQQLPLLYGNSKITLLDHLPAAPMQEMIQQADIILCRSGYTTLMEILPLHKKLILIPTPGQPEQMYLAKYYGEKRYALAVNQRGLHLKSVLNKVAEFPFERPELSVNSSRQVLTERLRNYLPSLS